jgi:hypothetical protein
VHPQWTQTIPAEVIANLEETVCEPTDPAQRGARGPERGRGSLLRALRFREGQSAVPAASERLVTRANPLGTTVTSPGRPG